jgi:hypothetical protein
VVLLLIAGASLLGILAPPFSIADEIPAESAEVQPTDEPAAPESEVEGAHSKGGWHHGQPFAYEQGLPNYVKFPRAWLSDHGVDVYLSMLATGPFIVDGGIEEVNKGTVSYDFQVYLDSAKLGLWEGGDALVRAEGKNDSADVNPYTGAVIPVYFDAVVPTLDGTDIEATEWWIAQELMDVVATTFIGVVGVSAYRKAASSAESGSVGDVGWFIVSVSSGCPGALAPAFYSRLARQEESSMNRLSFLSRGLDDSAKLPCRDAGTQEAIV